MVYISLLISAVLLGIDQLTKWLVVNYVKPIHSIPVININGTEILNFTYYENTGAAFSIMSGKMTFLIIITSIFIVILIAALLSKKLNGRLMQWAVTLVIGGGLGNLFDRIFHGYVVDFIDFRVIRFAIFNFADICTVVGGVLIVIAVIRHDKKEADEKKKLEQETSEVEEC